MVLFKNENFHNHLYIHNYYQDYEFSRAIHFYKYNKKLQDILILLNYFL